MKDFLNFQLNDPRAVSEQELRLIVKLLLEHLKLDAVRYTDTGHGNGGGIELEKSE